MAINLKFDLLGNPEPPSIVLANRNGNKLGQLNVNVESIDVSDKFNAASEFSFTLNKYIDDKLTPLWEKVVDFKLVYCPEWDLWFEIKVELDETTETVKTVFCTQLGQSELSQIKVYNIHINEEGDPNWDTNNETYKSTILYDEENADTSLLDRLLKDKAPHYSIAYVDESIRRIQRSFSFDDTSICDAFNEIAEEIGCLFIYNSNSTKGGKPRRTISVYDLQQNCNSCGHRGEFTGKCPKCNSKNITYGYGEDTTIFVTSDELATEGIQLVTDTDSVKNCFKLEGGDDLMTATIRNCNPNGSDYIWYFSDSLKDDMSKELVEKLESYDEKYQYHYNKHESELNEDLVHQYNNLVEKYKGYYNTKSTCLDCGKEDYFDEQCSNTECNSKNILIGKKLQTIPTTITGYPDLMTAYYNTIDLSLYLESSLMPNVEMSDTSAEEQIRLLSHSSLSPVAVNVKEVENISEATAKSAVLSMAKVLIKSTYKVDIVDGSSVLNETIYSNDTIGEYKKWTGKFIVTNYSDEEDTATSETIEVFVSNDATTFIEQKIEKALNKENTDDYSITGLFAKEYNEFCKEIKKYALNPLNSFSKACDTCLSILTEQGIGNEDEKPELYLKLYKSYYDKQQAINNEITIRENEIAIIKGVWSKSNKDDIECIKKGLQQYIEECQKEIQDKLNFEAHLGKDLWLEFSAYRREDKYSNENYISDGLNNAELFEKANEFISIAEEEIFKSAELQHSISATLNNLLSLPKFKPLLKSFKTGNWIRVQVDDKIYKLRLLEYGFEYGDTKNISVEFSDVTKIKNGITDVQDILAQASSMASSYDSVQRQAEKGNVARGTIDQWITDGLNSANIQISSNNNEEILLTKNGLLARSYDDITGTYAPEQFKLTHNIMAYTTDDWKTVSSALGKHNYKYYKDGNFVDAKGYGISAKFAQAAYIIGSQMIGGEIVSSNYQPKIQGTYINLLNGDFDFAGGKIVYDAKDNEVKLKGVTIQWTGDDGVNAPEVTVQDVSGLGDYLDQLENLEDQLDSRAQTWYQSTDPSIEWTDNDTKALHVGDLWHYTGETGVVNGINRTKDSEWVWQEANGNYQWAEIQISDEVFDLIDGKAQIFTSTPTPPYYIGDLWVQGSSGDILHCIVSKGKGETYNVSDWAKSSKYTDNTALNTFITGEYADELKSIGKQIDGKARSWYQPTDPSLTWNDEEDHEGDLWYNSSSASQVTCIYNNGAWQQTNVPKELFDTIDGIASIYVTLPTNPVVGDLLIPATDIANTNYKAGKVYRYDGTSWNEIKYTDDTALETFINGEYNDTLESLNQSIKNSKARSWYQEEDPSKTWDATENHIGDLWYCCDESQKTYIYTEDGWQETDVPKTVFDAIDGKRQIFVTKPTNNDVYNTGDLWILDSDMTVNGVDYKKDTVLVANIPTGERVGFNESDWVSVTTHDGLIALDNSIQALTALNDIGSDSKITPTEKQQIKLMMQNITSEYNDILKQCSKYSIATDNFTYAYNNLKTLTDSITSDLTTTITPLPSGYPSRFAEYYSAKEVVISDIEDATKGYSDALYKALEENMKEIADDLEQVDGRIQTYYQDEDPSNSWEDYSSYEGDVWVNTSDGATYQWEYDDSTNSYIWIKIENEYLTSLAKSKAQIFTEKPTSYSKGDLIIPAQTFVVDGITYYEREVYTSIVSSESFSNLHWTGLDYTNDDALNSFIDGYTETIQNIRNEIDGKADTYYQSQKPHEEYINVNDTNAYNLFVGDLWYDTSTGKTYIYQKTDLENERYSYEWKFMNVPNELFDTIDGIASIYVTIPDNPVVGDLLIPSEDIKDSETGVVIYKSGKVYRYNGNSWTEISYTDDTKANEAYGLANSAKSIAENAKLIGDELVNGLGFQKTEITGEYIITPVIAGGHLLIGDTTGTYAQITKDGLLKCANAEINGDIVANSLTLGDNIKLGNDTDGYHTWISKDGTLRTENANISGEIRATKGQIGGFAIEPTETAEDGSTSGGWLYSSGKTLGSDKSIFLSVTDMSGTVSSTTLNNWRLAVGEHFGIASDGTAYMSNCEITGGSLRMGTEESGYHTWISDEGVLNAQGANITGTVYATDGEFNGHINATSLTLGEGVKIDYDKIEGAPNIEDIQIDTSNLIVKGDITQTTETDSNGIDYLKTSVPSLNGETITYSTYNADDYIVFGRSKGTDSRGENYVCISKDGLLTARNALIYGTVYATDGEFNGTIYAQDGEIGGWTINEDEIYGDNAGISSSSSYQKPSLVNTNSDSPVRFYCGDGNRVDSAFVVLDDGSLYASAAHIEGTVYATDGEFTGTINATNGNIGGLFIGESNISSGDGGLTFESNGLIIAQDLQIDNELFTQGLKSSYISGAYATSPTIYLDGEITEYKDMSIDWDLNVISEGDYIPVLGTITDYGEVQVTITANEVLTFAKTFEIWAAGESKYITINKGEQSATTTFPYYYGSGNIAAAYTTNSAHVTPSTWKEPTENTTSIITCSHDFMPNGLILEGTNANGDITHYKITVDNGDIKAFEC